MTLLCVSIFVHDLAQAKRDIARAVEAGADIVELRLDELGDATPVRQAIGDYTIPFILTCRPTWEGGSSELTDEERVRLLAEVAPSDPSVRVDLELKSIKKTGLAGIANDVIISAHDFKGRPEKLSNLLLELDASPGSISKIVWMARSIRDNLEAFEVLQHRSKPTIALCMGEAGLISRVLAKKFGGFLTFASLGASDATAPGQVSIADMKRLYRWDAIKPSTKVYGVVAQPVMHSMSPAIHNAGFEAVGHDGVYLPLLVNEGYESFKAFMESFVHFDGLDLSGLSVTLPHKENALRYLQEKGAEVEELAATIGTVNTVIIDRADGQPRLRGMNTDYAAILDSITDKLSITREQLRDYRVAVIGAGGTGRTAVAALAHYGATVVVYNRTIERAEQLANEFDGRSGKVVAARIDKLCDSCCQIYINTTSVGMHPNTDTSPFGEHPPALSDQHVAFDTIYNPIRTKFLQHAEQQGARTISGVEMFVRQAAGQFQAWTAKPAPVELFRQVVEQRLLGKAR